MFSDDSLKSLPYCGLQHLQLHSEDSLDTGVLSAFIQTNTSTLKSIELSLDTVRPRGTPITLSGDLGSLSSFVQQPQFSLIKLSSIKISLPCIQEIIDAFLTSPASQQKQCLSFCKVYVSDPVSSANSAAQNSKESLTLPQRAGVLHVPPSKVNLKQMYFHKVSARSSFFSWLLHHPGLVLDTLCIDEFRPLYSPSDLEDKRAIELAFWRIKSIVRNLLFSFIESQSALETSYKYLGGNGLFRYLIGAVQHLACRNYSVRGVCTNCFQLSYTDSQIGNQPDEQVYPFFKALFSLLAKVKKLDVTFTNNCFTPRHLEMMYHSWKENAKGKHLVRLIITEMPSSQTNPVNAKTLLKQVASGISIAL